MQTQYSQPDASGHFGQYGGSFVSETLTHAIQELKEAYARYKEDPEFLAEFHWELKHFVAALPPCTTPRARAATSAARRSI